MWYHYAMCPPKLHQATHCFYIVFLLSHDLYIYYFSNIWWLGTWKSESTASWAMCMFMSFTFDISGYSVVAHEHPGVTAQRLQNTLHVCTIVNLWAYSPGTPSYLRVTHELSRPLAPQSTQKKLRPYGPHGPHGPNCPELSGGVRNYNEIITKL